MGLFQSNEILGIAGETLAFVLSAARETHPNEYMGFLRAEQASSLGLDRDGRVITDVLVIPGTESNTSSAKVKSIMQPNTVGSVGSIHSHPSGTLRPSNTDLQTFSKGEIHIILGAPYGWNDWQAFDTDGEKIPLDVLNVELQDEEFFDITQEDIDRELAAERADGPSDNEGEDSNGGWLRSLFR